MISITGVKDNRVTKYAHFKSIEECEAHASKYSGIVYNGDYSRDLWVENNKVTVVPVVEDSKKTIARLSLALDLYLDSQAKSFGYESIKTMVTYFGSINPKFKLEGIAALAFRDAVYTLGLNLIEDVKVGTRPIPSEVELLALMPKLTDYIK